MKSISSAVFSLNGLLCSPFTLSSWAVFDYECDNCPARCNAILVILQMNNGFIGMADLTPISGREFFFSRVCLSLSLLYAD